jgi:hypothetical protein
MIDGEQIACNNSSLTHISRRISQLVAQDIKPATKSHKPINIQQYYSPSVKMAIPTENNIAYWFSMSPSCTQMNNIGDENCKRCHAELAQGAAALDGGIDKIGDCVGKDSYGDPVWDFHEPETMNFTEARASTTYVQG